MRTGPFLINNGKSILDFSSQCLTTIGKARFFRSDLQSNNLCSNPVNLGYPINTLMIYFLYAGFRGKESIIQFIRKQKAQEI
jgi:hypothetical protein